MTCWGGGGAVSCHLITKTEETMSNSAWKFCVIVKRKIPYSTWNTHCSHRHWQRCVNMLFLYLILLVLWFCHSQTMIQKLGHQTLLLQSIAAIVLVEQAFLLFTYIPISIFNGSAIMVALMCMTWCIPCVWRAQWNHTLVWGKKTNGWMNVNEKVDKGIVIDYSKVLFQHFHEVNEEYHMNLCRHRQTTVRMSSLPKMKLKCWQLNCNIQYMLCHIPSNH